MMEGKGQSLRKHFDDAATWPNSHIVATECKNQNQQNFKKHINGWNV